MLHTRFCQNQVTSSRERFLNGFTIYGHGGHLGNVTNIFNLYFLVTKSLHTKFV